MASPITLQEVVALPDILDQTRFTLDFGSIPGGGDSNGLLIKCINAVLPPSSNEAFDAFMGGHAVNYRGRKQPSTPLSIAFYEDSNAGTLTALRTWHEHIVGTVTGDSQGYLEDYSVTARLTVFDNTGNETMWHDIKQIYPMEIPEVTMSAESSTPVQVQVQFRYTSFESNTHTNL